MKAPAAAQRGLLDLQAIDTTIAQLEHRRRSLPERALILEGHKQRAALGESLVAARTLVSDLEAELDKAEADLVPVKERRARDQRRLDDGGVSDPKQLNALIGEIEHLLRRIGDLEDIQLEVMERLEAATGMRDSLQQERTEGEHSLRALIASRDALVADIDAQLAEQHAKQKAAVATLPADLVALYRRIANRGGGRGAAPLDGRRCGGCQLVVTATAMAGFAAAPDDEVVRCEECECILVRTVGA
ncbi:MAG: hypothetical protein WCF12_15365 [Propionicimonas sp.]